jgi:hypothetical protein
MVKLEQCLFAWKEEFVHVQNPLELLNEQITRPVPYAEKV